MTEFTDNRPHLVLDVKKFEMWELELIEGTTTQGLLVLCRYLHNGSGLISPDLPSDPVDELPRAELARLKNSKAYKTLRRFKADELEKALGEVKAAAGF